LGEVNESLQIGEAANQYLTNLGETDKNSRRQETYKFVRWFGWERAFDSVRAPEVAKYAEQLSASDTEYTGKLVIVRAFLTYAKKKEWTGINLSVHLKARKSRKKGRVPSAKTRQEPIVITQAGYDDLQAELASLLDRRIGLIDDIRKAAADKDFKENAPLDAAKEQRGHVEGRIKELEQILASSVILENNRKPAHTIDIGDSIILVDTASEEELHYILVSSSEVNPANGKISGASPIGKAAIGKKDGDTIDVKVPSGILHYRIKWER